MPLTAEDVQNVLFQTSKKRNAGYDEDEVDAFLDQVAAELGRLNGENESLRAQLAARPVWPLVGARRRPLGSQKDRQHRRSGSDR